MYPNKAKFSEARHCTALCKLDECCSLHPAFWKWLWGKHYTEDPLIRHRSMMLHPSRYSERYCLTEAHQGKIRGESSHTLYNNNKGIREMFVSGRHPEEATINYSKVIKTSLCLDFQPRWMAYVLLPAVAAVALRQPGTQQYFQKCLCPYLQCLQKVFTPLDLFHIL